MPAFTVSRTTQIKSDPETVFAILSDFATWKTWSPWLLADKDATVTLQGDPTAVGGGYSWDGPVVGAGEMEHQELHPPSTAQSIGTMHAELRFTRPWRSQSEVDFEVKKGRDEAGQEVTQVRWTMRGSLPFFLFWMKSMMVSLMNMDFDRGLRMLKERIETGDVASQTVVNGIVQCQPYYIVGKSGRSTLADIGASMDDTFQQVQQSLADAGIATDGQWLSVYDDMNIKTQTLSYTSGMVLDEGTAAPPGLIARSLPGFNAMQITHTGRYEHLGNAWSAAHQNLRARKRKVNRKLPGVEFYLNRPENTPPEALVTELYVPLK
ncbi:Bacterial transcription activator, effector binding domain [Stieleria neptunia]|uniref:Bacterial transcription activator, effector binding domain n=1 Tax=Stieleria neptunia TaxID=2527979 RepID=A0A518HX08_9BACT|nr:GyrI-like domain-containing protein [Stieleria neptunia]QDV45381.1 Bacterial transcription activator, effector binding domain [Stieleria neptunia]